MRNSVTGMGNMPEEFAQECGLAFAWLTELLALEIHSLNQVNAIASWLCTMSILYDIVLMFTRICSSRVAQRTCWSWMPFTAV